MADVSRLNERHEGKTYAIVTHNTVIRVLLAAFLDMRHPYSKKLDPMYTSITIVEHTKDSGYALATYNQTSHLD